MHTKTLHLMLTALLGLTLAGTAPAQDRANFFVDGDPGDWRHTWSIDDNYDVVPDTNSTVDVIQYRHGWGNYRRYDPSRQRWMFAFILRFLAPPFQGAEETTVELFFDVSQDTTYGEVQPPWKGFRPDYRVGVIGENGALTKEFYRRYAGGQWVNTEGMDIAELEIALSGQWLEGAIYADALGAPDRGRPEGQDYFDLKWATQVSKGTFREYLPDGNHYDPWRPFGELFTIVKPESWGRIKAR